MDTYIFPNNRASLTQRQKRRDKRMAEEIIECRRYGGGDKNKKIRQQGTVKRLQLMESSGNFPLREPISVKQDTRLADNLEPLERFLRSNVGRPWAEVYSKLSRQLDRTTASGEHVFQHLNDYVDPHWAHFNRSKQHPYGIRNDGTAIMFAIHPTTGHLCILNPRLTLPKGPYPERARFKKAKQRQKSRLRLGLEHTSKPQRSDSKPQDLVRQFVQQRVTEQDGYFGAESMRRKADFWKDNQHVILNFTRLVWAPSPKLLWQNMVRSVPACYINGKLWIKSSQPEKPLRITFLSIWDSNIREMIHWEESLWRLPIIHHFSFR